LVSKCKKYSISLLVFFLIIFVQTQAALQAQEEALQAFDPSSVIIMQLEILEWKIASAD